MALLDKPNALIILDDVLLDETVRWFDELQCRIVATTRNLEIFQAASNDIIQFPMSPSGFTYDECVMFIKKAQLSNVSDETVIRRLHNVTDGLPAMINIILQLARDNQQRSVESLIFIVSCDV
ncbi:unnamed protein product [Anisakis simplex]|uniref:Cell death protein 4 (inferred by orthology to a C. elegans protein) n=1 Tax=Anisakis simplex TaxID=6269 RepID=A0A0M3JG39_ANISI|nr:unnamed protein product [Anisakis simplex]